MGTKRQKWLEGILSKYEGPLIGFTQRMVADPQKARDIVQEAFLRLWQADRDVDAFAGKWLFTVCRNLAVDLLRQEKKISPSDIQALTATEAAPHPVEVHEQHEQVHRAILHLSPKYQEVVRLRFQGELSYREIADVLGLTVTNVGFILSKALDQIENELETSEDDLVLRRGAK